MATLQDICSRLKTIVPTPNPWRWDAEFNVARIVFRKTDADQVLQSLEKIFDHCYDFSTIGNALDSVDAVIGDRFGIIPGQYVFAAGDDQEMLLLAAWWPWGNEAYISLRVGLHVPKTAKLSKDDIEKTLKTWFAVE